MLIDAVKPRIGIPAFNHTTVRCGASDPVDALTVARTVPMMADLRLIVVMDIEQAKMDFVEAFGAYAAAPSPTTVLVLTGAALPKSDKGGTLAQRFQKSGFLLELGNDAVPPVAFVRQEAAVAGKEISEEAARWLVECVGADLGRLAAELGKLVAYAGDEPRIEVAHVDAATALLAEAEVWSLTGAVVSRDRPAAVLALARLTADDDQEHRLLGMLGWQLREVAQGLALARAGAGPDEVARRTRLRPQQARDLKYWLDAGVTDAALLRALAAVNEALHGHKAGARHVLERFVLELSAR
jgi:DNA polymerase-3 subunit delta